jgi:hypothetical protein
LLAVRVPGVLWVRSLGVLSAGARLASLLLALGYTLKPSSHRCNLWGYLKRLTVNVLLKGVCFPRLMRALRRLCTGLLMSHL